MSFFYGWMIFYWVWWIVWFLFVGMFIVWILWGWIVCEFVICVLVVFIVVCVLWMFIFGGVVIDMLNVGGVEGVKVIVIDVYKFEGVLFGFLKELFFYSIVVLIVLVLIVIFFVISLDLGLLVIDMIIVGGKMDVFLV